MYYSEVSSFYPIYSMDFKEWLINEMAHKVIKDEDGKEPVDVATVVGPINAIDFRFEDYPKHTQEERNFIMPLLQNQIHSPAFFGKMPKDSKYAYFNGDYLSISETRPPKGIELPKYWWDYAEAYHGNKTMKAALRRRDYYDAPPDYPKWGNDYW